MIGTRPEAIKLAPLVNELRASSFFETKVCITSQHKEMLTQVLNFFKLKVDYDLQVMMPNQTLPALTAKILTLLSDVLKEFRPEWVVVQGDTTTAMAGAMAAFYERIKIAHVEAGLRSHNLQSPFPEEMNRIVISHIANYHFCPTDKAVEHLKAEGLTQNVYNIGNTVIDAALTGIEQIQKEDQQNYLSHFSGVDFSKKIILVTCHRRESFGAPFVEICKALLELVNSNPNYRVVYPVHLNPNIQAVAHQLLNHPSITLMEPLSYPQLLWLLDKCTIVLTDSGGIQEEAPSFKKPVLVLREVTERTEGVEAGNALLVGSDRQKIVAETIRVLENADHYRSMTARANPYGDGHAAERIVKIIQENS